MKKFSTHRLCIAPMMDHSDRHFRYLMRLLTKHAVLYTEMITSGALLRGDKKRFLSFNDIEHPVAIQLGGSEALELAECGKLAEAEGYDEINLNIGCPSDRVQSGQFGACLMSNPSLIAECVHTIKKHVRIPVTIKTRIGIDDRDDFQFLDEFIHTISKAGCETFIIHARKAILDGLSPKQNRDIPPLNYARVHSIKKAYPQLNIIINGGLIETDIVLEQLNHTDGVMIGRAAYQNPFWLTKLEQVLFNMESQVLTRKEIFEHYCQYMLAQSAKGNSLKSMSRHIIGLFQGQPGARKFRQYLSSGHPEISQNSPAILEEAIKSISFVS
ncbi:MAG: tRNA dihydrouridine(20/20a) synthase DusA [Pseudomonadota bacterium]